MRLSHSRSMNPSPNRIPLPRQGLIILDSFSHKVKRSIEPIFIDLTRKEPKRELKPLKPILKHNMQSSSFASTQQMPMYPLFSAPVSPNTSKRTDNPMLRKITTKIFASATSSPNNSKEVSLRSRRGHSLEKSLESSELYSHMQKSASRTSGYDKSHETLRLSYIRKPEQEITGITETTRTRRSSRILDRGSNFEVAQMKRTLAKIMDTSKEKTFLEKQRNDNLKHRELQQISQELSNLRKIPYDLTPLSNLMNGETPKGAELPSSFTRRSHFFGASPKNLPFKNDMYLMDSEYKQAQIPLLEEYTPSSNISKSRRHLKGQLLHQEVFEPGPSSDSDESPTAEEEEKPAVESKFSDHFNKVVMFKDKMIPFSLALTAKTRQTLFQEVKQRKKDELGLSDSSLIVQLRDKLVPEERARFLGQLDDIEKQKKMKEMKSKQSNSNAIYQMLAMNKVSQRKLKAKFEEKFAPNSRFLNDYSSIK